MSYGEFLLSHPFFWSAAAGVALGAGAATATRATRFDRRPRRAASRKWTAVALWATVAVVTATLGILFFDEGLISGLSFVSYRSLYVGLVAMLLVALGLRFPRAAGIPVFLLIAGTAVLGPLVLRPFVPVRTEAHIATVRLLASDPDQSYLEVSDFSPDASDLPEVVAIPSGPVVVSAHMIQYSDYLFFLGARGGAALAEISTQSGLESAPEGTASGAGLPEVTGAAGPLEGTPLVAWIVARIPWMSLEIRDSVAVELELLSEYRAVAGLELELRGSEENE